ncbi:MAG: hypothetical protein KGK01_10805 [Bradyrhizobium sp.]|uniref:hypothetical protein n=1 Tax=Bradyrhizobium sp. TaxID=376 RepID=UPI001C29F0E1|nr:hypothetical protein [Bradyrhizobium sp.]MBU6462695.1 hypothetical protein [Pseudomonadota bacterium]MDE2067829.1 hypothetical protein [Bradyrhizobium sp.]MDE2242903.1 hypothetical protein [Bradyrhizobium sp.]MDE2472239.1 hypothetical protein [Bradyrhizobium sp.]
MTRAITIIALICFLVIGVAATTILGRTSMPDAKPQTVSQATDNPESNKAAKTDRLAVATLALASFEPAQSTADVTTPDVTQPDVTRPDVTQSLRQAFAAQAPAAAEVAPPQIIAPRGVAPAAMPQTPLAPPAPKAAARHAPQKSYALLSDAQIAGIKERLRLSPDQEPYWPAVESALRAVARKIHSNRQAAPHATGAPIDPDSAEVQQLKSAAMPLLFQLREDQKNEVRTLARLIGLEKVAAQI